MSFGENLQFLRKMHNGMTQEALAEKMGVSRQTVSKWELNAAYPEMEKAVELCRLFSCTMDNLIRDDMTISDEAYSNMRIEAVEGFSYMKYAVISVEPESDAIDHVKQWAKTLGVVQPQIIGWDFPVLSQEQINVYHMHGYAAALVVPSGVTPPADISEVITQATRRYAAITIKEPFKAPFYIIPNAYKTLFAYMKVNGCEEPDTNGIIPCFEKEYELDGISYMDVYIAVK